MDNDREVDIEIQLSELKVWADRSLFYLAKLFTPAFKRRSNIITPYFLVLTVFAFDQPEQ